MSAESKAARSANKAKAKRLTTPTKVHVDASSYSIPDDMHAEAPTGMRPVSKRAFKRGGKVEGAAAAPRADRAPRASGGKAFVDDWMNRNEKTANEERPGIKHVGALARGGLAKRRMMTSGEARQFFDRMYEREDRDRQAKSEAYLKTPEGEAKRQADNAAMMARLRKMGSSDELKRGGRARKASGGSDIGDPRQAALEKVAAASARVPQGSGIGTFVPVKAGLMAKAAGMKRGGSKEGSAKDMAEDKMLARKRGMTMKAWERSAADKKHDRPKREEGGKVEQQEVAPKLPSRADYDRPGSMRRVQDLEGKLGRYAKGGKAHPASCACKECSGGRAARASGGRAKGRTNVNIIIATGGQKAPDMPPATMVPPPPPGGVPVPVPASGSPPPQAPMPMPIPIPMGGGAPMPRARGGRTYRSYKDMDAGALSGQGRLEKTEIQEHRR